MTPTVTLNITLSYKDAAAVLNLLEGSSETHTVTTSLGGGQTEVLVAKSIKEPDDAAMVAQATKVLASKGLPVKVVPTAGKKTAMPAFGRSQAQIDAFAKAEAERVEALDEEAELKAQRAEERAARKAEKDAIAAEKLAEEQRIAEEVAAIKAAELTTPAKTVMPAKPWDRKDT